MLLPIRTLLDAFTIAFAPIVVALLRAAGDRDEETGDRAGVIKEGQECKGMLTLQTGGINLVL